ncbi:hypothetical protein Kpol_1066p39 [Vanderwaltozyma polyspora DSM 70294]|uniref:FZ domain-containing protein n=1 Tax=Vanderwaltozyma polyspora (strain ATCC 22028 / DSM 70294 / BCRC 21397 / CBS 2163 / NBRC 10782 / NRRL Y-8283 / UCD 57-17) TaxID=436907 RepID=A7TMQ8_VANPO|nr:uncharacterized protein Kpol_1066p39 [Vanderwaltozyma polyspora DSM 70294]EDO16472.1 hypothetical protein Kpol_1066p39 [Vanderwaltozyma polyspora DSM 70294]
MMFLFLLFFIVSNKFVLANFNLFDSGLKSFHLKSDSDDFDASDLTNLDAVTGNISAGVVTEYVFDLKDANANANVTFSTAYELLVFMSGNICSMDNITTDGSPSLRIYYGFNESILSDLTTASYGDYTEGYFSSYAISPFANDSSILYSKLYIVAKLFDYDTQMPLERTPENENQFWNYTLSVSLNHLTYQWDSRSWLQVLDTDYNSALLSIGSSSVANSTKSTGVSSALKYYDVYIYDTKEADIIDEMFGMSVCAIKNGPYILSSRDFATLNINTTMLNNDTLAAQKISLGTFYGSSTGQFYITGLNSSTTYSAYLVKKIVDTNAILDIGGVLFRRIDFTTKPDNTCSLIFGLNFCSGVAYSVPTSSKFPSDKDAIAKMYDSIAESLYANFSNALQIIPCDTELDARYSPFRTCDDCAASYMNWLCAVSIPRCTTDESPLFIRRQKSQNRNSYINNDIAPINDYYEVLPCIDMCYSMVRDCPSDFGFACPSITSNYDLLSLSYNFLLENFDFPTCNYIGDYSNLVLFNLSAISDNAGQKNFTDILNNLDNNNN